MKIEQRPLLQTEGTILVHNIAYPSGKTAVRKGTTLTSRQLTTLAGLGHKTIRVAVLEPDDAVENEAALALAQALKTDQLHLSSVAGGRVTLRAAVDGLLEVEAGRLFALNMIPGVTLATRSQYTVAGPNQATSDIATLKIIPYAIPRAELAAALEIVRPQPPILNFRPLPRNRRAALLLTGEPAVHQKLKTDFERPIRVRLKRLGVSLTTIQAVPHTTASIRDEAACLAERHDLLIVAGQTSIMDSDDVTPHALTEAGATVTVYGAPVEPGNLLTLAYFPNVPVLGAPGCVRSLDNNIVDLVLPRLLLGDRLERGDIAQFGLGGLLK